MHAFPALQRHTDHLRGCHTQRFSRVTQRRTDHPFIDGSLSFSGTLITAREYSVTDGDWNMNEDNGADGGFKLVRKLRNAITHERFSADPGLLFYVLIELETPVGFNECITVVRLPTIEVDVGKVCEISVSGIRTGCGMVSYPTTSIRVVVLRTMISLLSRLTECGLQVDCVFFCERMAMW